MGIAAERKATARQIRKAFGPEAVDALDSHADSIHALNLIVNTQKAQINALLDGQAANQKQIDDCYDVVTDMTLPQRLADLTTQLQWWQDLAKEHERRLDFLTGELEMLTQAQLVHTTRLIRLEAPRFLSWTYLKALWS
jgi:hypothetical protein